MTSTRVHDDIGVQIGKAIRASRVAHRWPQRELANRIATTQSMISRIEAGVLGHLDARLITAAFRELGIRMSLDGATIGLVSRREQRDAVHARCAAYGASRLVVDGWDVRHEVEIGSSRYRGWIDLLA